MTTELNQEQQKAVTHSGSPLLIVAGPGSGKTTVIVDRIMHLVNSGIKPSEILCLTFTKKAAEEMSRRLENSEIFDVDINTFHSFAKSILEDNVLESGISISSGVIKRSAQLAWGLKNIDSFQFEHVTVGNNAEDLIRAIIDGIRTFKDELISPETLKEYLDSKNTIKEDIQMNVYALGTEKLYGKLPTKTSLFYIKHNKIVRHFIEEEKLSEFKEKLADEVESIFNEEFPAKPDSWKCSRCDYVAICDEKDTGDQR